MEQPKNPTEPDLCSELDLETVMLPNGYELVTRWTEDAIDESTNESKKIMHRIPLEMLEQCKNPYDDHDFRMGIIDQDIFQAESGIWLCRECRDKNHRHSKTLETWGWLPKWICDPHVV